MIVQVIDFAGVSVREGNTRRILDRGESARELVMDAR